MLSAVERVQLPAQASNDDYFRAWRERELSRVDREGLTYADYTGAALYPESLVRADADRLCNQVYGNPHSEHGSSKLSTERLAEARLAILKFLHASPDEYDVVLTANASAACKLVAEGFAFDKGSTFLLSGDNHNSINGIREFARRAGAKVVVAPLDEYFELRGVQALLQQRRTRKASLFAYPAQSNFTGVRHPLSHVRVAQSLGWRVLLDAASYLPTADLHLEQVKPDFVVLSLYKIIGFPAGVGALVARRDALDELRRPWFAGGTVRWVSVSRGTFLMEGGAERFEDGTPAFISAGAVKLALDAAMAPGRARLAAHLRGLTSQLLQRCDELYHSNGHPLVRVYARHADNRGATVAITMHDLNGATIPYWSIEKDARDQSIALRGGCFCNPGCAEAAFGLGDDQAQRCLAQLGYQFSVPAFATCLDGKPVGAIRMSFGLGSIMADVDRLVTFLSRYRDMRMV